MLFFSFLSLPIFLRFFSLFFSLPIKIKDALTQSQVQVWPRQEILTGLGVKLSLPAHSWKWNYTLLWSLFRSSTLTQSPIQLRHKRCQPIILWAFLVRFRALDPRKVVATGSHECHLRSRPSPLKVRSLKKWVGFKFPLNESQPKMRAFVHPSVQSANRIGYDFLWLRRSSVWVSNSRNVTRLEER